MMSALKVFFSLYVMMVISVMANSKKPSDVKVIYGDDDRVEPYTIKDDKLLEVSNSVAAMIPASDISSAPNNNPTAGSSRTWGGGAPSHVQVQGNVKLNAPTLVERGFCSTERFSNQITAAMCSGFLVGENILVTAGHCIESEEDCRDNKWVFGYQMNSGDKLANLTSENVYSCTKILGRNLSSATQEDFAVIQLDRKVEGRVPMKLNSNGHPNPGDEMIVLGHPTGLPQKIAGGAVVKSLSDNFFFSNLDTYGGNSGSAVINARTYEVEGILVRGNTDYIPSSNGSSSCGASNVLPDDTENAEEVSFIGQVFPFVNSKKVAGTR